MLRTFASPCAKWLGFAHVILSAIIAFRIGSDEIHVSYVRWPDLAHEWMEATAWSCFSFSGLIAFNSASLCPTRSFFATHPGRRGLTAQLLSLALAGALWTQAGILVGQVAGIIRGFSSEPSDSVAFILTILSCTIFLFVLGLACALIGFSLSAFHPAVAALCAVFFAYVILVVTVNSDFWKSIVPLRSDVADSFSLFSAHNAAANALELLIVGALAVALVLLVLRTRSSASQRLSHPLALGAVIIMGVSACGIQILSGPRTAADNDVCQQGSEGITVCVNRADSPGLSRALDDIDAVQRLSPAAPVYTELVEVNSHHFWTSQGDEAWVSLDNAERRIDASDVALSSAGVHNCHDLNSEGAFVIERVAVFFLTSAHAYSDKLEKYGALYQSINEGGTAVTHNTYLTDAAPEEAQEAITQNWDDIYSCTASMDLLHRATLREVQR